MDDFQRRFPRTIAMVESRIAAQDINESAQHIPQQRYGKICPSCKSGMSWQEIKSGKCWNCGSYIDATGKLRQ